MTVRRAIEFAPAELASHLTSCFEGYIMPFVLDAPGFERRFRPEHLDSEASLIMFEGEDPAAICLIARRGWTCRCAAMAVAPRFRRQGLGLRLMEQALAEAKQRGDRRFVLEVIEQNPPAIELYKRAGLRVARRIVGYGRGGNEPVSSEALEEMDPLDFSRLMVTEFPLDVPWDYMPENLCKASPTRALTLEGRAFALLNDTPGERVILWSFFTRKDHRLQGHGRRLIEAVAGQFPGKVLATPVAFPDDLSRGFFEKNGFSETKITQFEMVKDDLQEAK